jgi:hypothetical protein
VKLARSQARQFAATFLHTPPLKNKMFILIKTPLKITKYALKKTLT